jgi:hypothetical protein
MHVSSFFLAPLFGLLGIADGVGGWGSMGIDAGLYARRLMEHASAACTVDELRQQPQLLLEDAHDKVNADRLMGSCTACIAVFENGLLRVVNLGDSGAIGVRPSAAQPFLRTEEQQHYFNCVSYMQQHTAVSQLLLVCLLISVASVVCSFVFQPYQLGSDNSDRATQGQLKECAVQHNDIIVLGTDGQWKDRDRSFSLLGSCSLRSFLSLCALFLIPGFFDNLFDADITRYIRRFVEQLEARSYLPTMEAIAAAAAASDRPSSAPQAQRAGLHTSANDLAASLSAPRAQTPPLPSLSPSSCAASASASLHTRAFPTAPAGEPAGPIEQVALAFPPLSTSSAAATLADASSSPSSVASHTLSSESLQRLADELVREALHKAHGKAPTPFSEAARRARKKFNGGKLDDITIVIAQIVDRGGSGAATGVSAAEAPSTTAAMFGHSVSASAKL